MVKFGIALRDCSSCEKKKQSKRFLQNKIFKNDTTNQWHISGDKNLSKQS